MTTIQSQVIMTQGFPGCGKSTWAKAWVAEDPDNRSRVSRDDLRAAVFNSEGILTQENEQVVTALLNAQIATLLKAGKDVVIDATNLNHKFAKQLAQFCIKNGATLVDTKPFPVSAEECIRRDAARKASGDRGVGADVINNFAKRFPVKNWPVIKLTNFVEPIRQYEGTPGMPIAATIDIDGTIADLTGVRGPYDTSRYHLDTPHPEIVTLVKILRGAGLQIVFLSGRSEDFYEVTWNWLTKTLGFEPDALVMRKTQDLRNDAIIKPEIFWESVAPNFHVLLHIDDRQRVVDAMRALGLPVLQCRPGDF